MITWPPGSDSNAEKFDMSQGLAEKTWVTVGAKEKAILWKR